MTHPHIYDRYGNLFLDLGTPPNVNWGPRAGQIGTAIVMTDKQCEQGRGIWGYARPGNFFLKLGTLR